MFSLSMLAYQAVAGRRVAIKARLSTIRNIQDVDAETGSLSLPFRMRVLKPAEEKMIVFLNSLLPPNLLASTEHKLVQAGNPRGLTARVFLTGIIITAIIFTFLGFTVPLILSPGIIKALLGAILACLISIAGPFLWLQAAVKKRIKQIDRSLPDAIDLMVVCVEAGLGFDMALVKVTRRMEGPLIAEFSRALREINIGKTRQEALRDLSKRAGSHNLSSFLSMVIQGTQMGVSMGQILRVQSETMRRVRRQKAEETALKAPIKMVFPLVFFILPALFVIILGPALIQILNSTLFS